MKQTLTTLLFLVVFYVTTVSFAYDVMMTRIILQRNVPVSGYPIPNRAPSSTDLSIEAFYDDNSQSITLSGECNEEITYYICDDKGNIVLQDICMLGADGSYTFTLVGIPQGTYTLHIVIDSGHYQGSFDIWR